MKTQHEQEVVIEATKIIQQIEDELSLSEADRSTKVSDSNLRSALRLVKQLRARIADDRLPPKENRYGHLTHLIADQWPLGTRLGNRIAKLEHAYRDL